MQRRGATLVGGVHMGDTNYGLRYSILLRLLVQNLLDFASVLRATHMPNSYHYLKVFVL